CRRGRRGDGFHGSSGQIVSLRTPQEGRNLAARVGLCYKDTGFRSGDRPLIVASAGTIQQLGGGRWALPTYRDSGAPSLPIEIRGQKRTSDFRNFWKISSKTKEVRLTIFRDAGDT